MAFLPNTMPLVLSVLGAGLSLIVILTPGDRNTSDTTRLDFERSHVLQAISLVATMVLFAMALRPLGFILSSSLFLIGCGMVLGERRLKVMVPISLFGAFFIWYLVQEVLGIFMRPWPGFLS